MIDEDTEMTHPEEFVISGSPIKEPEEEIELSSRGVVPSERRIGTPERAPATKRRPITDHKSSPPKRLVIDPENNMESEDVGTDGALAGGDEMQFEEESYAGGDGGQDSMIGMFTSLNIVDISEVFSPPRVVMQGMKTGLKAGSSMDLLTGWNVDLKADRDRALKQLDEEN